MQDLDHSLVRFSRQSGTEIVVSLHSMFPEWLRLQLKKGMLSKCLKIYGGIASAELSENNRIRLQIAARGAIALG